MAITVRLYAGRSKWPLEGVSIDLHHEAIDASERLAYGGAADRISIRMRLNGPLTEAQRERLRIIAARCPVHRALAPGVHFEETLEPPVK